MSTEQAPDTYSSTRVARILAHVGPGKLQHWDKQGYFRPSFYRCRSSGALIPVAERPLTELRGGGNQGAPSRAYTYEDLLWLRLYLNIIDGVRAARRTARPYKPAAALLKTLRHRYEVCPSAKRLLFHGDHVFMIDADTGHAECLSHPGELAMAPQLLSTSAIHADVRGRLEVLGLMEGRDQVAAHGRIGGGK